MDYLASGKLLHWRRKAIQLPSLYQFAGQPIVCGRFNLRTPAAAWTQEFLPLWTEQEVAAKAAEFAIAPRYNIAPTQNVSCIRSTDDGRRQWSLLRWGLVPSWATDLAIGNRMINARSETVDEKRSFKKAFMERRCLVPADGYYEWQKTSQGKQPFLIQHADGKVLAMAALWECNRKLDGDQQPLETFTILTTAANQTTSGIHDRMPVFLAPDAQAIWLDDKIEDPNLLKTLLHPAPEDWLTTFPVSTIVNSPRNDTSDCIKPIELPADPPQQQGLF